ncbi:acyl-CoA dehydrogenase [Candidatus Heimdallarchaeota archaeon B3_Heim]|nr:MAG: acyl-CoA dehydrogenase [Candidatus Heimdallarchaeota archaeon B3_Heim]
MIDFSLSEEQISLQKKARNFAINEIIPVSRKYDLSGEFPYDVYNKAFEAGLLNITIPKENGGLGLGILDSCLLVEEIAAADPGITTSLFCNSLGQEPIILGGNEEQKERFLRPFTEELQFASFATSEPGMGSDVAGMSTTARVEGDELVINGRKMWITNGGVSKIISLFCRLEGTKRHKGVTAVVVPTETAGLSIGKPIPKMGHKASNTVMLRMEDVRIPLENVLGEPGQAFPLAMQTFAHTRPTIGAFACGMARGAMEYAIAYAKKRKAFETEIANLQAIQFMIAEMKMHYEAARLLTWKAAWEADKGWDNTVTASCAKAFATDSGMKTASDALQIFGGYGYTTNYLIEKLFRDAKLYQIYEGTSQVQRMIIGRFMLSKYIPVFDKVFS